MVEPLERRKNRQRSHSFSCECCGRRLAKIESAFCGRCQNG